MESSGLVTAKFCFKISSGDVSTNELTLPTAFYTKFRTRLIENVELKLRNGYVLPLQLEKRTGVLRGFLVFFMNFELKGGELLLFEYFGRWSFNVHILGSNFTEIDYPLTVHFMQRRCPRLVTLGDGGWRFAKMNSEFDTDLDEITPTPAFLERCEFALPPQIDYLISNGKKFCGSYCRTSKKFKGLRSLCGIVGVPDLSGFYMMIYEYHLRSVIKISVFDESLNEIIFPGTPLTKDCNNHYPSIRSYFTITVEAIHMVEDCYIVEISNEFKEVVNMWEKDQSIFVYSDHGCWRLQTKKRDDHFCRTIEDGWKDFRDGMQLNVGDRCIFECPRNSFDHFSIRVLKELEFDL